jgi:hypothetical protein
MLITEEIITRKISSEWLRWQKCKQLCKHTHLVHTWNTCDNSLPLTYFAAYFQSQ